MINQKAKDEIVDWVVNNGGLNALSSEALVEYAFGIATKYGEASGALSAEFYDAVAELEGVYLPPAQPAATATYGEVAKAVNGTISTQNEQIVGNAISRLVKLAGIDTTVQNAVRDEAEWAWIPSGDTCPYCIALASRGWQEASLSVQAGNHAEHVHANCDCAFAVRHNRTTEYTGYNPGKYKKIYDNAQGSTARQKMKFMEWENYNEHRDEINARKRAEYAARKAREEAAE